MPTLDPRKERHVSLVELHEWPTPEPRVVPVAPGDELRVGERAFVTDAGYARAPRPEDEGREGGVYIVVSWANLEPNREELSKVPGRLGRRAGESSGTRGDSEVDEQGEALEPVNALRPDGTIGPDVAVNDAEPDDAEDVEPERFGFRFNSGNDVLRIGPASVQGEDPLSILFPSDGSRPAVGTLTEWYALAASVTRASEIRAGLEKVRAELDAVLKA